MAKLVIYASNYCEPCRQMVPVIKRNARARGDKVKIVDLDHCPTKECEKVAYSPTVLRDGKELSGAELEGYLK